MAMKVFMEVDIELPWDPKQDFSALPVAQKVLKAILEAGGRIDKWRIRTAAPGTDRGPTNG